jgi:hypothetical protein
MYVPSGFAAVCRSGLSKQGTIHAKWLPPWWTFCCVNDRSFCTDVYEMFTRESLSRPSARNGRSGGGLSLLDAQWRTSIVEVAD